MSSSDFSKPGPERRDCCVSNGDVQCHWKLSQGDGYLCCRFVEGHQGDHKTCYEVDRSSQDDWYDLRGPAELAAHDAEVRRDAEESLYLELQSAIRKHIKEAPMAKLAASALLQDVFQVCKRGSDSQRAHDAATWKLALEAAGEHQSFNVQRGTHLGPTITVTETHCMKCGPVHTSWADHIRAIPLPPDLAAAREMAEAELIADEKRNSWKRAIIEAHIVNFTLSAENETDPKASLHSLLCWEQQVVLDPKVSSGADALVHRGYRAGVEAAAIAQCELCRGIEGLEPIPVLVPEYCQPGKYWHSLEDGRGHDLCQASAIRAIPLPPDLAAARERADPDKVDISQAKRLKVNPDAMNARRNGFNAGVEAAMEALAKDWEKLRSLLDADKG